MAEIDTAASAAEDTAPASPNDLFNSLRSTFGFTEADVEAEPESEDEPSDEEESEAEDGGEGSETDEAGDAPETATPSLLDAIKGKSEKELEDIPEIKSLIARKGEGERRKAEHETAARLFAQQQEYAASGQATKDFIDLVAKANTDANGNPQVDPDQANRITGALLGRGVGNAVDHFARVLNEATGDGFTLTADELDGVEGALARYRQKPTDPSPLIRAWLTPYARHVLDSQRESIKAEALKEARAEVEAQTKASKAKAATEARKGKSPTGVNGQPVQTKNEWDAANADLAKGGAEGLAALRRLGVNV